MRLDVPGPGLPWRASAQALPRLVMLAGLIVMALPTLAHLVSAVWLADEQGHGPVILAVCLWLIWQRRDVLDGASTHGARIAGWILLLIAAAAYLVGRSQAVIQLEVLAPILAGAAIVLLQAGWRAWRGLALPLVCLLFVVPLPGVLVQTVTIPLKIAVSHVAEAVLHLAGYPVARSGVILAVDRYQLLVADACAGLTSMFTLEAMGLIYIQLRGHAARLRNALLALLIVPVAFLANVIRVIVLVLVTYHFGDHAGQGFVHGAAGILLFVVAMLLMLGTDALLGRLLGGRGGRP